MGGGLSLGSTNWQQLTLEAVWWGAAVLFIRALSLAYMSLSQRVRWLTVWTGILACLNIVLPFIVIFVLGTPLTIALTFTAILFALDVLSAATHPDWSVIGAQSYIAVPVVAVSFFAYALTVTLLTPMNWLGYALSGFLLAGEVASALIDLYYTSELLDVVCRRTWRAQLEPWRDARSSWPKVSIHVPAHDEPPEMVLQTLRALMALDYPSYEIIMIDDNTDDDAKWRPVMEFSRDNGIKVYHLQQYPGYKAGALNFALHLTDPAAEVVAIVDADYIVEPNWLRETAPYFEQDPQLAFLQTPQSFTYEAGDGYRRATALGEDYFFTIGMPSRAERNSIIFCGTMGLFRRRVLERIGGWAEWCVTEDAEASFRVLARGYRGAYLRQAYGRGTLPPTVAALKRQHYRWAFGSIHMMRSYLGLLLFRRGRREGDPRQMATAGKRPHLTRKQRYDYVMHGFHWYHPFLQLCMGTLLNVVVLLYVFHVPFALRPLVASALLLPVLGIVTGVGRVLWSAHTAMRCSWREAWGVLLALMAVQWGVARACLAGLYRRRLPFFRTPRAGSVVTAGYALRSTAVEIIIAMTALLSIGLLLWRELSWQTVLMSMLLLWHSFVWSAAPALALMQAYGDGKMRRRVASAQVA